MFERKASLDSIACRYIKLISSLAVTLPLKSSCDDLISRSFSFLLVYFSNKSICTLILSRSCLWSLPTSGSNGEADLLSLILRRLLLNCASRWLLKLVVSPYSVGRPFKVGRKLLLVECCCCLFILLMRIGVR